MFTNKPVSTDGTVHQLRTPTGRSLHLLISSDGTRWIGAQFHKRELLSITIALDGAKERMQELGCAAEQREFEELRDMFLKALHHDA